MKKVISASILLGGAVSAFAGKNGNPCGFNVPDVSSKGASVGYALTNDSVSANIVGRGRTDFAIDEDALIDLINNPNRSASVSAKGSLIQGIPGLPFETKVTEIRDLAADRPDATESPITVDKGYWQIETSVVDYSEDGQFQSWTWAETNLKYGLTDSLDIQFVFAPYIEENDNGSIEDGTSDLTIRLKYNLWGNDGGESALALFPYVKAPLGGSLSNDEWEGGLILPYAREINDKWGFGCQLEWEYVYDADSDDYDSNLLHTAVLGYSINDQWGAYIEYLGITGSDYQAHASGGITYAVTRLFQLDLGAVVGLNDAANDFNTFTGFTVKF